MPPISPERLLCCIRRVSSFERSRFRPFLCEGQRIGWVTHDFAAVLAADREIFKVEPAAVSIAARLDTVEARSQAVNQAVWRQRDLPWFRRWNGEYASVSAGRRDAPLLHLARCATVPFGVRTYGAHVNGYVRDASGLLLWVARRAAGEPDFGGQLDTLVGGFIGAGLTPDEIAEKELGEEAGFDVERLRVPRAVGGVSGIRQEVEGVRPFSIYCYDLELGAAEQPVNRDGEIDGFELLSVPQIVERLEAGRFKFNAVWVVVDWLMRNGFVAAEGRHFIELAGALRHWDPE
jgi:8-oxo-dGTP pyrophosphatase MutT (NUDIX family)